MATEIANRPKIDIPATGRRDGSRDTAILEPASPQVPVTLFFLLTMLLLTDALVRSRGPIDYWILNRVQDVDVPYMAAVMDAAHALTGGVGAVAVWAVVLLGFIVGRRWLPALAVAVVPAGVLLGAGLRIVLPDSGPLDETLVSRTLVEGATGRFPSVAVTGAVLLFGLLFGVAGGIPNAILRYVARIAAVLAILAAGMSRVWLGSGWPIDILAGYALGGLLLALLLWAYRRVDTLCGDLPFIHAAAVPHDESRPHAHALTSTIVFNGPTVSKIYAPGFVPRAAYWLAFQAEFPYIRNEAALRAAVLRRNLAGLLTEYWYGENRVARATGIDTVDGRNAITSEYIDGTTPADKRVAREFLLELANRFDEAGLPTWQIDPRQPRALDNILETPDGRFHIIDLESGLVSPLASPRAWARAFRRGLIPIYDDVYFDLTRRYVLDHEADMRARHGDAWFDGVLGTLDEAERVTQEWRDGEPRIWGRLLGLRRHRDSSRARAAMRAQRWLEGAIDGWRDEGRLSSTEAGTLRKEIREPRFLAVLPHFGVHLTIGVLLRFPFGSIVRASYVLLNLLLALLQFLARRIDRNTWRQRRETHSPLVVILSGMPGIGTFAYLASKPVRSNQLLVRVCLDAVLVKLPFRVYERVGLRWLVARPRYIGNGRKATERAPVTIFGGPQSIVQNLAFVALALLVADAFVTLIDYVLAPETPGWSDAYRLLHTAGSGSLASWYVAFPAPAGRGTAGCRRIPEAAGARSIRAALANAGAAGSGGVDRQAGRHSRILGRIGRCWRTAGYRAPPGR
jgi:membrane-associated phospholipid phosphatase